MIPASELRRRLEESRARLLADLAGLDEPRFSMRPKDGGWSVAHVCEHLARVDDAVATGARRAAQGPPGPPVRWTDRLRQLPYRWNLVDGVRVRTGRALDPETVPPRAEALVRIAAARVALTRFLADHERLDLSRWTLPHPVFGRMPLDDMIGVVAWHEERHRRQVGRILAALAR